MRFVDTATILWRHSRLRAGVGHAALESAVNICRSFVSLRCAVLSRLDTNGFDQMVDEGERYTWLRFASLCRPLSSEAYEFRLQEWRSRENGTRGIENQTGSMRLTAACFRKHANKSCTNGAHANSAPHVAQEKLESVRVISK